MSMESLNDFKPDEIDNEDLLSIIEVDPLVEGVEEIVDARTSSSDGQVTWNDQTRMWEGIPLKGMTDDSDKKPVEESDDSSATLSDHLAEEGSWASSQELEETTFDLDQPDGPNPINGFYGQFPIRSFFPHYSRHSIVLNDVMLSNTESYVWKTVLTPADKDSALASEDFIVSSSSTSNYCNLEIRPKRFYRKKQMNAGLMAWHLYNTIKCVKRTEDNRVDSKKRSRYKPCRLKLPNVINPFNYPLPTVNQLFEESHETNSNKFKKRNLKK